MKQILRLRPATVPMAAALVLAGCTGQPLVPIVPLPAGPSPVAPSSAAQADAARLVNNLNQLTDQDLKSAINLANAMTPPDTEAVMCFQFIQAQLPVLRAEVGMLTAHGGAFTTFEAGHILVGIAQNGLPQKAKLEQNCGPYLLNAVGGLNFLLEQIKVNPVPLPKL